MPKRISSYFSNYVDINNYLANLKVPFDTMSHILLSFHRMSNSEKVEIQAKLWSNELLRKLTTW